MQQISLSQRAAKNEMEVLKKDVESKIDDMEVGMESKMENMKNDLKENI